MPVSVLSSNIKDPTNSSITKDRWSVYAAVVITKSEFDYPSSCSITQPIWLDTILKLFVDPILAVFKLFAVFWFRVIRINFDLPFALNLYPEMSISIRHHAGTASVGSLVNDILAVLESNLNAIFIYGT